VSRHPEIPCPSSTERSKELVTVARGLQCLAEAIDKLSSLGDGNLPKDKEKGFIRLMKLGSKLLLLVSRASFHREHASNFKDRFEKHCC
jgi:hypothetical protein